nr:hypothetical protein CDL12_05726 [Ipomoea trifida]
MTPPMFKRLDGSTSRVGKPKKYAAPSHRRENKKSRPKPTHNPSGILEASRWSHMSKAPFVELGISRNLEEEVYLAAFLACWLCTFVVPGEPTATIRPETFKMACKMTKGIKVCLVPPVFTSIYYGLNSISESTSPGQIGTPFPSIMYMDGYQHTSKLTSRPLASCYRIQRWPFLPEKAVQSITTRRMLVRGSLRAKACLGFACLIRMIETSFFMTTREGAKRTLNTSYVYALVFSFYAKDPSVKLSLMFLNALVINSDSTKHIPPACC